MLVVTLPALLLALHASVVSGLTFPVGQPPQTSNRLEGRQFGGIPGGGFGLSNAAGYGGQGDLSGFPSPQQRLQQQQQPRGGGGYGGGYGGYGGDAGGGGGGGYGAAGGGGYGAGGGGGGYGGGGDGGGGGPVGGTFAPIGHPTKNPALGLPFQWGLYTYGDLGGYAYGYKPYYTGYAYPLPTPFGEYPNDDSYPGFPDIVHPSAKGTHKIKVARTRPYSGAYGSTYADSNGGVDSSYGGGGSSPAYRDAAGRSVAVAADASPASMGSPSYGMMNSQQPLTGRSSFSGSLADITRRR